MDTKAAIGRWKQRDLSQDSEKTVQHLLPPREALKVAGLKARGHHVCKGTVNIKVFFQTSAACCLWKPKFSHIKNISAEVHEASFQELGKVRVLRSSKVTDQTGQQLQEGVKERDKAMRMGRTFFATPRGAGPWGAVLHGYSHWKDQPAAARLQHTK